MNRFAVDTNAVIDYLRTERPAPCVLQSSGGLVTVFLSLPVLGELFAGVTASRFEQRNREDVEELAASWNVLHPVIHTARAYGRIRGAAMLSNTSESKRNDFWIAALCLQHDLPLLTNDRGFDSIDGLTVVHW